MQVYILTLKQMFSSIYKTKTRGFYYIMLYIFGEVGR